MISKYFKDILDKMLGNYSIQGVYDYVDPTLPHGIYIYDQHSDKWIKISINGFFKPALDGIYVIYFDNAKCGACRVYDLFWFPFVKLIGNYRNVYYVITLCEWFARNCGEESAIETFKYYDVHASPTTMLLLVRNGNIFSKEKIEGIKRMHELSEIIENFAKKHSVEI
ncbi:MAG: hypothetical protein QXT88_04820 [Desulfurococcaceae archaeon]|uniref:Thioredoxin n=1 Tax=Staphylothermus marinus TaxID=2280 RepID=A0A7C4DAM4_STAMA